MSRFMKRSKPKGLMLTSLLDMFTIILIFLIVSFEAEDQAFKLDPDLRLPESSARSVFKPSVNVVINPQALIVEQKVLMRLEDGKFPADFYTAGEIPELVEALKVYAEQMDFTVDEEEQTVVTIQADKDLDYQTLYLVMRSSSMAGFARYRLAIMKK
ncbi:MAG: biopolymer transporter ExbD [Bradymonadaceae bacterium]|nr:biopolymer transporter ExbD [Lujinxingiaceae bacterium]